MVQPRPHFRPSYTVHISPTNKEFGAAAWHGRNHWIVEGFELRTIIGLLYSHALSRIEFENQELSTERYDLAMVPPREMGEEAMKEAIRDALQHELGFLVIENKRLRNAYIVTAPDGPLPALEETEDRGTSICTGMGEISMRSGTIAKLCSALERDLGRPVIDETELQGHYSCELKRKSNKVNSLFEQMQNELGLFVSSGERDVAMLVVRRR